MTVRRKIFVFVAIPLLIIFAGVSTYLLRKEPVNPNTSITHETSKGKENKTIEKVIFTKQIFDPVNIDFITPLGELNGGYEESQTISGVMINIKRDLVSNGEMIDVFAPTAMTLYSYAYYSTGGAESPNWTLVFNINKDVVLKFDHITEASDRIVKVTTSTPKDNSREDQPIENITIAAGELIGRTSGTHLAKNWNIYMYDNAVKNSFINQPRYEQNEIGMRLISGACPFDYYDDLLITASYAALMGATAAGQSATCGSVSHDVAKTISGIWHFNQDINLGIKPTLDGKFASPLAIYKDSSGRIVIHQIDNKRFDLKNDKDPAEVTSSHCYLLKTQDDKAAGFAFFKLISPTNLSLAYSSSGSCPSTFPTTGAKTYYR